MALSTFDVLFKNFMNDAEFGLLTNKIGYPVDIYRTEDTLYIEIAAAGVDKSDITVKIEGDILRVDYNKEEEDVARQYIHKSIARRAFNFGWKIAPAYHLSKATVTMDKGILKIAIPEASTDKMIKTLEIQ